MKYIPIFIMLQTNKTQNKWHLSQSTSAVFFFVLFFVFFGSIAAHLQTKYQILLICTVN